MPRKSTIKRLPPEVRERIGVLLDQGRTLDEILEALAALDVDISRSALHRYKQSIDKVRERIGRSRAVAEAVVQRFGDGPEHKLTRANVELMHSLIMEIGSRAAEAEAAENGEDGEGQQSQDGAVPMSPMEAMLLSKALDHLAKASRNDAELIARIREEATKVATANAAKAAEVAGREKGLSLETVEAIKARILGVRPQGAPA